MDNVKFYKCMKPMECLAGDTLDRFHVKVNGAEDLTGMSMRLLVISEKDPDKIVLKKNGEAVDDGFTVQLTTEDTAALCGVYYLDFVITGADGNHYKKLRSVLTVRRSAKGAG